MGVLRGRACRSFRRLAPPRRVGGLKEGVDRVGRQDGLSGCYVKGGTER